MDRRDFTKILGIAAAQVATVELSITSAVAGGDAASASTDILRNKLEQPMALGLPPLLALRKKEKTWRNRLDIKDGVLLKEGQPFFPVGYVLQMGDDGRCMPQMAAMGCNAVEFEVGWSVSRGPGPIPAERFDSAMSTAQYAAEWGMASFVLLSGHYVPNWFASLHPVASACPLGSDGKPTGSFTPYSLNYPPFRQAIVDFWKSAASLFVHRPSTLSLAIWNEPCYGGTWDRPGQYADYSKWGIHEYRLYLHRKYGSIDGLNRAYNQNNTSFNDLLPPREPSTGAGRAGWLDWMECGQQAFSGFFARERREILSAAPTARLAIKKQTNPWDSSAASSGDNWYLMGQSEDVFGLDIYGSSDTGYRRVLECARSYADGKPVIIGETNANAGGTNATGRTPDVIRCQLWSLVLGGAQGMFIYAFSDDDAEYGLLNDEAVSAAGRAEYVRFTHAVSNHQRQIASPFVRASLAVLYSTTAALQNAGTDTIPWRVASAMDLFLNSHYQTDVLPEERCTAEGLAGYQLVVLPSGCILKSPSLQALGAFVGRGGKVIAFGDSLATDEYLRPTPPPAWLGIDGRKNAIGNRTHQAISKVDPSLYGFVRDQGTIRISGVELVSQVQARIQPFVPGDAIVTKQKGRVLAWNRDGYPCVLQATGGNVVYCAFQNAPYSEPLRGLIEGITRQCLGIKQRVRLLRSGMVDSEIMVSLRQDFLTPGRRYMLVLNRLHRHRTVAVELGGGWRITREALHDLEVRNPSRVCLAPRDVFLFELTKG